MQALKALVIFLGILVLAAAAVIAVTIYKRATNGLEGNAKGFGTKQIALPAGAELEDSTAAGDRLILQIRMGDGSRRIMIVDLATGEPLGELEFVPAH